MIGLDLNIWSASCGVGDNARAAYAANGISPDVVFDFRNGLFLGGDAGLSAASDYLTFARASSATYTDSAGVVQTALSGVARDNNHIWDGSAWVNAGRLVEPNAATNLLLYSDDLSNGTGWNTGDVVVAQNGLLWLIENNTGSAAAQHTQTITLSTSTTYTYSVRLKQDDTTLSRHGVFDSTAGWLGFVDVAWSSGVPSISTSSGASDIALADVADGEYVLSFAFTTAATLGASSFQTHPDRNATTGVGLFVGTPQLEVGSVPTSYIPTTGAQATRAAETLDFNAASVDREILAATGLSAMPAAVCFGMSGRMSFADDGATETVRFWKWKRNGAEQIFTYLSTSGSYTGAYVTKQFAAGVPSTVTGSSTGYTPGLNVPFSVADRHGATFINGAHDGTLLASASPSALTDVTGYPINLANVGSVLNLDVMRIWFQDIGDTGIQEATT